MNSRRLTRPPDLRRCQSIRSHMPALKQLLHREVPGRAMSAVGQMRTRASHDQAWFSGLLLPQQRTNLAASPKTTAMCHKLTWTAALACKRGYAARAISHDGKLLL